MPNLSVNISGSGAVAADSVVVAQDVTVGDDILLTGELNGWYFYSGSADPTAGGGVAHSEPAVYRRTGTNQVWISNGSGATAWVRLVDTTGGTFTGLVAHGAQLSIANVLSMSNAASTVSGTITDGANGSRAVNLAGGGAAATINSLQAVANQFVIWVNTNTNGAYTHTFVHESGTGTAVLKFACPGAVDYVLNAGQAVLLFYDLTISRWRVVPFT